MTRASTVEKQEMMRDDAPKGSSDVNPDKIHSVTSEKRRCKQRESRMEVAIKVQYNWEPRELKKFKFARTLKKGENVSETRTMDAKIAD